MSNVSSFTIVGVEAALLAGQLLRKGFGTQFQIKSKPGKQNLVTEYDHAAEDLISDTILKKFPSHSILGEESGLNTSKPRDVCWIIDPLDGTINFARNIPVFAVSIGIAVNDEIVAGVIYQPITDELFIAEKGNGAYFNKASIHVSTIDVADEAVVATGLPYELETDEQKNLEDLNKIFRIGTPLRILGSAAINMAYLAAGRVDAYWSLGLGPWDIAAGKILIEEAGGKVTDYKGGKLDPYKPSPVIATNGKLHKELLSYL